jgi:hypothetical protein
MGRLRVIGQLLCLVLLIALMRLGIELSSNRSEPQVWGILALLGSFVGVVLLSMWVQRSAPSPGFGIERLVQSLALLPLWRLFRLIPLLIGIALSAAPFWLTKQIELQPWGILAIWAGGIGVTLLGLLVLRRTPTLTDSANGLPWLRWEWPLLFVLLWIAVLTRTTMLDQIPYAMHGDEAEMGLAARNILYGNPQQPFSTGWLSHSVMWFVLQAIGLATFGNTLGGIRMISALWGFAAVIGCLLYTRPLYGRLIGWGSAFFLAAYPMHIHFSRIALNNIVDPTLFLFVLICFFWAWRNGSLIGFYLAGVLGGFAQHFYFGARLIPFLLGIIVLHQLILNRQQVRQNWPGLVVVAGGSLAGIGPLLTHYLAYPDTLSARLGMVGLFQTGRYDELIGQGWSPLAIIGTQIWHAFGAYVSFPEIGVFYAAQYPLVHPFEAIFFLTGIGVALWQWRKPEQILLVAWIISTALLGGAYLVDAPQVMRYVIAAPAICLAVAIGMAHVVTVSTTLLRIDQWPHLRSAIIIALLGWACVGGIDYYFRDYTPNQRYAYTRPTTMLAYYIATREPDEIVYFLGPPQTYIDYSTIRFLAPNMHGRDVLEPIERTEQVPTADAARRAIYVALPFRQAELIIVQERYPGGRMRIFTDPLNPNELFFMAYEAP